MEIIRIRDEIEIRIWMEIDRIRLTGLMIDQIKTIKSQNISGPSDASLTAMTNFCQTLLNSNEFLYID